MNTLSSLLFIETFVQVTKTIIKSLMGSKFGKNKPQTAEVATFERLKKIS